MTFKLNKLSPTIISISDNTSSPAAKVTFSNENPLTGRTEFSLPFNPIQSWAKEHPWVTNIIILSAVVLCGVVIYKRYSGKTNE